MLCKDNVYLFSHVTDVPFGTLSMFLSVAGRCSSCNAQIVHLSCLYRWSYLMTFACQPLVWWFVGKGLEMNVLCAWNLMFVSCHWCPFLVPSNLLGHCRKMLEHAVVFQLKATANDDAKQGIVDGLLSLKESCAQWVKTEAVGKFQSSSCLLFVSMYTLPLLVTVIRTLLSVN